MRKTLALFDPPVIQRYGNVTVGDDMDRSGSIKEADGITGGLSKPSKMPRYAFNISAAECKVGRQL